MMKRISTFAFVLWLGGLSCALGSAPTLAAVGRSSAASEASAVGEAHACCRVGQDARRDNAAMHEVGGLPAHRAMECCPLAGHAFEQSRRWNSDEQLVVAATTFGMRLPAFSAVNHTSQHIHKSHLPDRGDIYLRRCMFLI